MEHLKTFMKNVQLDSDPGRNASGSRLGRLFGPLSLSCGLQFCVHGSRLGMVHPETFLVGFIKSGIDLGRLCVIAAGRRLGRGC